MKRKSTSKSCTFNARKELYHNTKTRMAAFQGSMCRVRNIACDYQEKPGYQKSVTTGRQTDD